MINKYMEINVIESLRSNKECETDKKVMETLFGKQNLTINLQARTTTKKIIIHASFHLFLDFITQS